MKYGIEIARLIAVLLITFNHTEHNLTSGLAYWIFEELPLFGTPLLLLVSGYLFSAISRKKSEPFFTKKIKSLLIPFVMANILVLLPVCFFYFALDINYLDRLSFDYKLITDGIFAINDVPVNPPTYFIRDIFIVFVGVELLLNKNWKMLLILIPLTIFGKLIIRWDIPIIFAIGYFLDAYKEYLEKTWLYGLAILLIIISALNDNLHLNNAVGFLLFLLSLEINVKFIKTGAYTYLLHLYHSPIMVFSYPLLALVIDNEIVNVILQILISMVSIFFLYKLTRWFDSFKILSGFR